MKKPQADAAAIIPQAALQATAATEQNLAGDDFPLQLNMIACPDGGDGIDSGSIFIAEWQVKQQVLHIVDTNCVELLFQCRANTF